VLLQLPVRNQATQIIHWAFSPKLRPTYRWINHPTAKLPPTVCWIDQPRAENEQARTQRNLGWAELAVPNLALTVDGQDTPVTKRQRLQTSSSGSSSRDAAEASFATSPCQHRYIGARGDLFGGTYLNGNYTGEQPLPEARCETSTPYAEPHVAKKYSSFALPNHQRCWQ